MNYRHIFHAGNFCDVFKHALLVPLVRGLQRKEKGFLFLDTHAGLGTYDLRSSSAERTLEYVDGIGRLWSRPDLSAGLREYVELVRQFNATRGKAAAAAARPEHVERGDAGPGSTRPATATEIQASTLSLRYYPGSPRIASALLRPQDRLALAELHPDDFETLRLEFARDRGVGVQCIDAYSALRAYLPPPERRALVLIDPPYEDHNEVVRIHAALEDALQRFPSGMYVIWYPVKDRSGVSAFKNLLGTLSLPPTLTVELTIYANDPPDRLNGCGLVVLNPPWQIARELESVTVGLRDLLALEPGADARVEWLREEE